MRFIEISPSKIVLACCHFHTLTTFNYPFTILFLNICYEIAFVKVAMFGYQTLKRLARGIRLQIKNSKIPRKNSSGNLKIYNIQKYFKTLAKLEYMKYVVCAESFEGVGAL